MKKIANFLFRKIQKDILPFQNNLQYDLIVFSHLRWEFVTQRPQHLISRISSGRKVMFVEEPIGFDEENRGTANVIKPTENITVIQPRIDAANLGQELEHVVKYYQAQLGLNQPVLWFYSAAFLEMVDRIQDRRGIVYDCMDELSAFKGAPQDLRLKEQRLISLADLVFTGGKSLYESKKNYKQEGVYCFPSSVDRRHFEAALKKFTEVPADFAAIKRPTVGFYGVIDERIDLGLLAETADLLPEVSFVMIGPVVKISESDLPQRANIYYLGSKPYSELPHYLRAIDIAMMPFALNESTRFISPTKTLEFMAAGKPIVSTPITDVVRDYSETVSIVKNSAQFAKAVRTVLEENAFAKKVRMAKQMVILNKTSWDSTASKMDELIKGMLEQKYKMVAEEGFEGTPAIAS